MQQLSLRGVIDVAISHEHGTGIRQRSFVPQDDKGGGMTKVLATGTFDILHTGHLDYLEYAKSLGDYLVVHIESDEAVKRHKGENRPVNNQDDRQRIIESLKIVDETLIADGEKEASEILKKIKPDILVIAPKDSFDPASKELEFKNAHPGIRVVWFDRKIKQISTSGILNKIEAEL